MTTFVVAHGAWSGGWSWKKMRPLIGAGNDQLVTPTYTGLGERSHLANPAIDLETHVADVLGVLQCEDLRDVVLIGHSYGGMVATGVADRARDRIRQLIYLDAFVPVDGQSLADLLDPGRHAARREATQARGDGWRVPPNPQPADTAADDVAWLDAGRAPHPIACFEQPLRLRNGALTLPRSYVYCMRAAEGDVFRTFMERARQSGWPCYTIESSHNPHVTEPRRLASLLREIVARTVT